MGTLVHRLFQAEADPGGDGLEAAARRLLAAGEVAAAADPAGSIDEACRCYRALAARPGVTTLVRTANCLYEVPFSMREAQGCGGRILRGSIDCLAVLADGRAVVLEIKTGRRQPWHEHQLEVYVRAARELLPGVTVEGRLVYPGE